MSFVESLVEKMLVLQVIQKNDADLYKYGIIQGFLLILNFGTLFIISAFIGMKWECFIFIVSYSLLRAYAGGYHTRTPLRCYIFSVFMIIAAVCLIKLWILKSTGYILASLLCGGLIFWLAPIEDSNKPLDSEETKFFRKKARANLCMLEALIYILWLFNMHTVSICIVVAMEILSIMLLVGAFKNKFISLQGGKNND